MSKQLEMFEIIKQIQDSKDILSKVGTETSGFRGHRGRPGQVGGSVSAVDPDESDTENANARIRARRTDEDAFFDPLAFTYNDPDVMLAAIEIKRIEIIDAISSANLRDQKVLRRALAAIDMLKRLYEDESAPHSDVPDEMIETIQTDTPGGMREIDERAGVASKEGEAES